MDILRAEPVDLCLDGSVTTEYHLVSAVTRSCIEHLGSIGTTEYFSRFARPFFRIRRDGLFIVKGIEGDTVIQVTYLRSMNTSEDEILSRIRAFSENTSVSQLNTAPCSSVV